MNRTFVAAAVAGGLIFVTPAFAQTGTMSSPPQPSMSAPSSQGAMSTPSGQMGSNQEQPGAMKKHKKLKQGNANGGMAHASPMANSNTMSTPGDSMESQSTNNGMSNPH